MLGINRTCSYLDELLTLHIEKRQWVDERSFDTGDMMHCHRRLLVMPVISSRSQVPPMANAQQEQE
jgi:hypothetical protein